MKFVLFTLQHYKTKQSRFIFYSFNLIKNSFQNDCDVVNNFLRDTSTPLLCPSYRRYSRSLTIHWLSMSIYLTILSVYPRSTAIIIFWNILFSVCRTRLQLFFLLFLYLEFFRCLAGESWAIVCMGSLYIMDVTTITGNQNKYWIN